MQEVEVVEIHGYYLVLGIVFLNLHCNDPLYRFLQRTLHHAMCLSWVKLLRKLLGNGWTSSSVFLSKYSALDYGTSKGKEVYARMVVESCVLSCHKCLDDIRREFVVIHAHPVLLIIVPRAHHLAVGREHLRGKSVDGILQVLDGRHITYLALGNRPKSACASKYNHHEQRPKEIYKSLSHLLYCMLII